LTIETKASKGVDVKKLIVKCGVIPDEVVIAELRTKGVLYDGPDHYVLQGGEHTNCFFYPFRVGMVASLPLRLGQLLNDHIQDDQALAILAVSDTATRMMRSIYSAFDLKPKKVYPMNVSGKLELKPKQIEALKQRPFIIIDDVVRKGRILQQVVEMCEDHQLTAEGIFCVINAGIPKIKGVPIHSLLEHPIQQWDPDDCPLCKSHSSPVYDPFRFKR